MSFAEKYVRSLGSSDLRDDPHHHATEALTAAAVADIGDGLGSLLCRVKYADGSVRKTFEGGSANMARLLKIWTAAVTEKGQSRGWIKTNTAWDLQAAFTLYKRVAETSLMHWLDGKCGECGGTGLQLSQHACPSCKGTGKAEIICGGFEREKVMDMISELEGLIQAHNMRAAYRLGRRA